MSAIHATQPGPLTWVKPEIDFALDRARASLAAYFAEPSFNGDSLSAALASVREVSGALQIIGMEALGAFSKEVDAVLVALAEQNISPAPEVAELLDKASRSLQRYLSDLAAGAPENPMSLRSVMGKLVQVRGGNAVDDRALFHPDLSAFPPPLMSGAPLEGDALSAVVRVQRGHYQRGMLSWLRGSEGGLVQMLDALQEIERTQPAPARRAPWWVASAFVEGLLRNGLSAGDDTKRAAGRIDRSLASFASGAPASTELIRELLFHLAQCEPVTLLVREVKALYRLDRCVSTPAAIEIDTTRFEPALRRAKGLIAPDGFSRSGLGGSGERAISELNACFVELHQVAGELGCQPLTALVDTLLLAVAELAGLDAEQQAEVALEIAATLSAFERRLQDRQVTTADAAVEFDTLQVRLLARVPGARVAANDDNGLAAEPLPRQRGDRELLQVVGNEMTATLQEVEQSLDAFFRGRLPIPPLAELPGLLGTVAGALTVLCMQAAAEIIERCTRIVAALEDPGRIVSEEETALLAEGLSSVMLFVQALDRDSRDELRGVETILARFDAREALLASSSLDFQTTAEDVPPGQGDELDFELFTAEEGWDGTRDRVEVKGGEIDEILDHFDLSALQDDSEAESVAGKSHAEPQADATDALPENAFAALGGDLEYQAIDVDARVEGIDPEIVSIFIEEANELLVAMEELLEHARARPDDWSNLTTLRRSFHTIKGSGRMAGLPAIGDAAWTIESLLNQWLEAERPASQELIGLCVRARDLLAGWITDVGQHGRTMVQTRLLSAEAERVARELDAPGVRNARTVSVEDTTTVTVASLHMTIEEHAVEPGPCALTTGISKLPAPLFRIFIEEALENVEALRIGLEAVDFAADDEARDRVIRAAHTLGGIARATGFTDIALAAGVIEKAPFGRYDRPLVRSAFAALEALVALVAAERPPELATELRTEFERQTTDDAGSTPMLESPRQQFTPAESPRSEIDSGTETGATSTPRDAPDRRMLKDDIDPQLLPIFLDEVRDLGPLIGEDLRHLRDEPGDVAAFDSLRRVLHTIKGGARMVGAIRLGELVHIMEGRLEQVVERGTVSPDILDLLEGEFDRVTGGLESLENGEPQQELPIADEGTGGSAGVRETPGECRSPESVSPLSAHIRVAADTLDRLLSQAGEISISRGRIEAEAQTFKQFLLELTDSVARLRGQLREIEIQAESRLQATQNQTAEHDPLFDPLEFDRFTRFQELTRLMAESLHDVTTVQHHLLDSLGEIQAALNAESRLNRILQDDLMRLRTVTFQNVAERLYRVARQAARETGKKVEFDLIGGQTEVDRGVLERMAAPLEHMVRNAVTHGIEAVDQRIRTGKPEGGTIRLMLRQETNDLLISLADDGRGIDYERIRAKAIELGWLPADAELSRSELEQMILRPGFSTAREVNELAGRGVGMDVVGNEVHALGGTLEIATESGRGTTFTIRVPLTLAVIKALLVAASGRRWAILSNLVEQVQEVPADRLSDLFSSESLEWLGHRYPVFYLPQLWGGCETPSSERQKYFALLIRSGDRRVAVLVDHLTVNQDVVLKTIGPQLAGLPGVNGASILPNGEVVFVVNPAILADRRRTNHTPPLEPSIQTSRPAPLVMVVDDSLTVRNVTSRLLVRHGYRVATARDGLDALQQIQDVTPDALLVDIEMPRMDGFELTKNLKASQRTVNLPIIMITSRLAPKHRQHATELGVDVYLGKPFEGQELLAHLGVFTSAPAPA